MSLLAVDNWLRSPADHDIIKRWTIGAGQGRSHALSLPQPRDPERFTFLALGDSGDSESAGPGMSPQDAVAREMVRDTRLGDGGAVMVLHMGDVVYMTGEHRLYDRNFRRPYSPFLTESSTVGDFTFRMPFLPVPGNHDYYDLGAWAKWLSSVPLIGAGLRALWHEIMPFAVPEGGSEMGKTYMDAFVDPNADTSAAPLPYVLGERTRLPNRYYKFQLGSVDFFALDSNTLDAPSPEAASGQARLDAAGRVTELEEKARAVDEDIKKAREELEAQRGARRLAIARDPESLRRTQEFSLDVGESVERLRSLLEGPAMSAPEGRRAAAAVGAAETHWDKATADLSAASGDDKVVQTLARLETASDEVCASLSALEEFLAVLPEGAPRTAILEARTETESALHAWAVDVSPPAGDISARLKELSEGALDLQRELVLARRRSVSGPDDYDSEQLAWLDRSLEESIRLRPNAWRVVYLHHPLYTTIGNHCERSDVLDVRGNLTPLLAGRAHLMLAGHSHAFEWFRSDALPGMGVFVTGGGGQMTLRPSILSPERYTRFEGAYDALRRAGVTECVSAGAGPAAPDGENSPLYHYLHIEVTPDTLTVRPIGVRRAHDDYRREDPMPVHHTPTLPAGRPPFVARALRAVEVTRGGEPKAVWV